MYVVGATPVGAAPTTSERSTILLPANVRVKGHLHQRGKGVGCLRGSRPWVLQWFGLKELCGAVYTAAGPHRLRAGPAVGARRDRSRSDSSAGLAGIGTADWSVFIDQRSSAAKWGSSKVKLRVDPS